MRHLVLAAAVVAAGVWASPALANSSLDAAPSAREVQSSVDAYLASSKPDASLVAGPGGSAGYSGGFWIAGGSFLMKINLTLQSRWEWFEWDDSDAEPSPGGDLSGYSLPRATLKFSGDATCATHYYLELEFGHVNSILHNRVNRSAILYGLDQRVPDDLDYPSYSGPTLAPRREQRRFGHGIANDFGTMREGWI